MTKTSCERELRGHPGLMSLDSQTQGEAGEARVTAKGTGSGGLPQITRHGKRDRKPGVPESRGLGTFTLHSISSEAWVRGSGVGVGCWW